MLRIALLATALLAGCAQVEVVPVTERNPDATGIRFYGPKPILVVSASGAKIEIIPNLSEEYAMRFVTFLAKNHSKVTLNANGTLAALDANMDTTAVIALLEKAIDKLPSFPAASDALRGSGDVAVYDFVFRDDGTFELRHVRTMRMGTAAPPDWDQGGSGGAGDVGGEGSLKPIAEDRQ